MANDRRGPRLPERQTTVRSELKAILHEGPFTTRDLSVRVGVGEKDVAMHLEHIARSVQASGERFEVEPPRCLACGFVFKDRTRMTKPSRCPRCKGERLAPARYRIATTRKTPRPDADATRV